MPVETRSLNGCGSGWTPFAEPTSTPAGPMTNGTSLSTCDEPRYLTTRISRKATRSATRWLRSTAQSAMNGMIP